MKGKKRRELLLQENIKGQIEETRDSKLFQLGKRCELCTVFLLWTTAFGYAVAIGASFLFMLS